jgi:hypothetical protein
MLVHDVCKQRSSSPPGGHDFAAKNLDSCLENGYQASNHGNKEEQHKNWKVLNFENGHKVDCGDITEIENIEVDNNGNSPENSNFKLNFNTFKKLKRKLFPKRMFNREFIDTSFHEKSHDPEKRDPFPLV